MYVESVDGESRNSTVLRDFIAYCRAHPDQRFWQALRNWSGQEFIKAQNWFGNPWAVTVDTFNWEGKDR